VRASTPTVDGGYTRAPTAPRGNAGADRRRHLRAVAVAGGEDGDDSAARGKDARRRGSGAVRRAGVRARVAVVAERAAPRRCASDACTARTP
jgi:hypothetical protein